jgi:aminocarboxymuconate-semialdehyde decarboxylase
MTSQKTIDIHAHVIAEETMRLMQKEAPKIAPRITSIEAESALFEVAGSPYRPFPRGGFDLERRFKDMAASAVDMQAVSVPPQTFLYDQDASLTATFARIQNEEIAKLTKQYPDRFLGLATLPMQAPEQAAAELRRAVRTLGLSGAMIGSNIEGRNLDDPALEPVWAAAAEVGAFMLIHPTKVAGADRLRSYYLTNLIGNPLDTTIAAASLVFGGVLERHPNIKICLSHGGGFTPYQAGRWVHGWHVRNEPKKSLAVSPEASLRRFYYDTIVHARPQLESLVGWAGASHVLLGSDYPFDMGTLECVRQVRAASLSEADRAIILGGQAAAMLAGNGQARRAAAGS